MCVQMSVNPAVHRDYLFPHMVQTLTDVVKQECSFVGGRRVEDDSRRSEDNSAFGFDFFLKLYEQILKTCAENVVPLLEK